MPREGKTFVNAVGKRVVAHGGATPKAPVVREKKVTKVEAAGIIDFDVFGREYDIAVPAFLTTGGRFVLDRIAMATARRGGTPFGFLIDIEGLNQYALDKGYTFPSHEIGMPPPWWEDTNNPQIPLLPGTSNNVLTGSSDNPTRIVGVAPPADTSTLSAGVSVYIPTALDLSTGPFLIMGRLINFTGPADPNWDWQLRIHTDGSIRFQWETTGGVSNVISTENFPLGELFLVDIAHDGTTGTLAINGNVEDQDTAPYIANVNKDYEFLDGPSGVPPTNVQISDVLIVEGGETTVQFATGYDPDDDTVLVNDGSFPNGSVADSWGPRVVVGPPAINVPDTRLPTTDPTLDLAPFTIGPATSWQATGDFVSRVVGSIVTFADQPNSGVITFTARSSGGTGSDTAQIDVEGGPVLVTPPVISGSVGPGFVLSLDQAAVWDGTEVDSDQEWYVNDTPTGVVGDTYTIPAGVGPTDVFSLGATATSDLGVVTEASSNSLVMIPPQLEIPDELLVEGSNTFDIADYTAGYVESYDATGAGVESISGSVVTVVNQSGLYTIRCTASNPAGPATADVTVRVVPANEYVNAALAGGAPSGPADGNNPPNNHTIGFNTVNSAPIDNGDGTFSWKINPLEETGRSYLTYSLADNHPTLQVGDSITVSWKLRDFSGVRTIALTTSVGSLNNVDLLYGNQQSVPNSLATVQVTATVTGLPFEAQFRVGVGPTTDRAEHAVVNDPIAFVVDPPDAPTVDMWILELA